MIRASVDIHTSNKTILKCKLIVKADTYEQVEEEIEKQEGIEGQGQELERIEGQEHVGIKGQPSGPVEPIESQILLNHSAIYNTNNIPNTISSENLLQTFSHCVIAQIHEMCSLDMSLEITNLLDSNLNTDEPLHDIFIKNFSLGANELPNHK